MYEEEPARGLVNAVEVGVHDVVWAPSPYPNARPREPATLAMTDGGLVTTAEHRNGDVVALPLVGTTGRLPEQALTASVPGPAPGELRGLVWFDASPAGGRPSHADAG